MYRKAVFLLVLATSINELYGARDSDKEQACQAYLNPNVSTATSVPRPKSLLMFGDSLSDGGYDSPYSYISTSASLGEVPTTECSPALGTFTRTMGSYTPFGPYHRGKFVIDTENYAQFSNLCNKDATLDNQQTGLVWIEYLLKRGVHGTSKNLLNLAKGDATAISRAAFNVSGDSTNSLEGQVDMYLALTNSSEYTPGNDTLAFFWIGDNDIFAYLSGELNYDVQDPTLKAVSFITELVSSTVKQVQRVVASGFPGTVVVMTPLSITPSPAFAFNTGGYGSALYNSSSFLLDGNSTTCNLYCQIDAGLRSVLPGVIVLNPNDADSGIALSTGTLECGATCQVINNGELRCAGTPTIQEGCLQETNHYSSPTAATVTNIATCLADPLRTDPNTDCWTDCRDSQDTPFYNYAFTDAAHPTSLLHNHFARLVWKALGFKTRKWDIYTDSS